MRIHLVGIIILVNISVSSLLVLAQETSTSTSISSSSSSSSGSRDNEESNIPRKVLRKYRIKRPVVIDENGNAITARSTPKLRRVRVNKQPIANTPRIIEQSSSSSIVATPESLLDSRYGQSLVQQNANDPIVVEPVRVVPQYRKATPSSTRQALLANVNLKDRDSGADDTGRKPNIGTTRNYSTINEDGSFTFGYEGEDGSFKEETRGIDCVVRGKYGYVDPDGVRREFAYVSGNPCDPNNPDKDSDDDGNNNNDGPQELESDFPQVRPTGIISNRPRRPISRVNNDVGQSLTEQTQRNADSGGEAVYQIVQRPRYRNQPLLQRENPNEFYQPTTFRPRFRYGSTTPRPTTTTTTTTPAPVYQHYYGRAFPGFGEQYFRNPLPQPLYQESTQTLDDQQQNTFTRFNFDQELQRLQYQPQYQNAQPQFQYTAQPQPTAQPQLQYTAQPEPQTTARPQFQYTAEPQPTARPLFQYNTQPQPQQQQQYFQNYQPTARPQTRQIFGGKNAAELLQKYHYPQLFQPAEPQPTPTVNAAAQSPTQTPETNYGNYRTELIYDPSSGQYTSVLVQDVPKSDQEFTLTQRFRGFVDPQSQSPNSINNNNYIRSFTPSSGSITRLHADAQEAINSPSTGHIDSFLQGRGLRFQQ